MDTIEYRTIDKSAWPRGPWDDEPDKVQWPDEATGLPCLALRNDLMGNWCGYVGVPETHPLYKTDGGRLRAHHDEVSVHGGVTFADTCRPDGEESTRICHVPSPGDPDNIWWFGFDCGHAFDYQPATHAREREFIVELMTMWRVSCEYRSLDYVKQECARLATQLLSVKDSGNK